MTVAPNSVWQQRLFQCSNQALATCFAPHIAALISASARARAIRVGKVLG